jgi:hypothetical protein
VWLMDPFESPRSLKRLPFAFTIALPAPLGRAFDRGRASPVHHAAISLARRCQNLA